MASFTEAFLLLAREGEAKILNTLYMHEEKFLCIKHWKVRVRIMFKDASSKKTITTTYKPYNNRCFLAFVVV